jgi:hypothetical protein
VGVRNVFGGAESAHINYSFGNRTKAAVEGVLETPFRGNANAKMGIFLNGSIRDHSQVNAFKENAKATGVRFTVSCDFIYFWGYFLNISVNSFKKGIYSIWSTSIGICYYTP